MRVDCNIAMPNGMLTNGDEQLLAAIESLLFRGHHGFLGFYGKFEMNQDICFGSGRWNVCGICTRQRLYKQMRCPQ
jgi:hypothetical protein